MWSDHMVTFSTPSRLLCGVISQVQGLFVVFQTIQLGKIMSSKNLTFLGCGITQPSEKILLSLWIMKQTRDIGNLSSYEIEQQIY